MWIDIPDICFCVIFGFVSSMLGAFTSSKARHAYESWFWLLSTKFCQCRDFIDTLAFGCKYSQPWNCHNLVKFNASLLLLWLWLIGIDLIPSVWALVVLLCNRLLCNKYVSWGIFMNIILLGDRDLGKAWVLWGSLLVLIFYCLLGVVLFKFVDDVYIVLHFFFGESL